MKFTTYIGIAGALCLVSTSFSAPLKKTTVLADINHQSNNILQSNIPLKQTAIVEKVTKVAKNNDPSSRHEMHQNTLPQTKKVTKIAKRWDFGNTDFYNGDARMTIPYNGAFPRMYDMYNPYASLPFAQHRFRPFTWW
jgi:hypothetical protein